MRNQDEISAGPKQDSLPQFITTYPPTIKALQTTKITKLGPLSPLVFHRRFTISELKNKFMFLPPGKQSRIAEFQL